ncbi:FAD:protein FMN transferase [Coraliomargarita parva]|uniref:FAD:protein FMN transferase n=1 Tax=Coraliomargarita parva TaxID=3014050 RepID=UPI0022B3E76F|nr:FAD:protein FMN transferase [Coraliomargarita parva]
MAAQVTPALDHPIRLMQRRRFIRILATSAAGMSLQQLAASTTGLQKVQWQGFALGTTGQLTLFTEDRRKAETCLQACSAEIRRLESIFSLYDHHSELCQLNRDGYLKNPTKDWRRLLAAIEAARKTTEGAFDPSIQRLWKLYQEHFSLYPDSDTGPSQEALDLALQQTGWDKVRHTPELIRLEHAGMQLSLNGIAQGYITDRVSEQLKEAGYTNVLVELGEARAIGSHPKGRPWRMGIKDAKRPDRIIQVTELNNRALATSGSYESRFSKNGQFHHLIHPRTGLPSAQWSSVSVLAPTATEADALSTGLSFLDAAAIERVRTGHPELDIICQA